MLPWTTDISGNPSPDATRARDISNAQMGVAQSEISRIEKRHDMLLSTLTSYLSAAGENPRVVVTVNGKDVELDLTTLAGALWGWTRSRSSRLDALRQRRFPDRTLAALVQSACNKPESRLITHDHVRSGHAAWMAGPCRIPKLTVRVRFPSPAPHAKSVAAQANPTYLSSRSTLIRLRKRHPCHYPCP